MVSNHRPRKARAGDITRPMAMLERLSPAAQREDGSSVHREAFIRLVLRVHVQRLWAGSIMLAF